MAGESIQTDSASPAQANNVRNATSTAISRAAELLRAGEVVGLPTETVYGLAGDALNPLALARIFEVKHRPLFDPLIVHVPDAEAAWNLALDIPVSARLLAENFWPGPLTLVLKKRDVVPDLATSGLPHVALRVPAHPVAQAVLRACGRPLAAPSANRFGRISPTDAQAVWSELGNAVPLILEGGPCEVGLESTVLDLSGDSPVLLRAGGVPLEKLEELVGPVGQATSVEKNPLAPGQLKHHYAPRKPLRVVAQWADVADMRQAGILAFGESFLPNAAVVLNLSSGADLREAAANFFRALRSLDDHPAVAAIYATSLPDHGLGRAINDRLERASHGRDETHSDIRRERDPSRSG